MLDGRMWGTSPAWTAQKMWNHKRSETKRRKTLEYSHVTSLGMHRVVMGILVRVGRLGLRRWERWERWEVELKDEEQ